MNKLNFDLDQYSHYDLCDMFELEHNDNVDGSELNTNYNRMITNIHGEIGIPEHEKANLLKFLEKAFKKLLGKDKKYKLSDSDFTPDLEKSDIFSKDNPVIKRVIGKEVNDKINPIKMNHISKLLNINTIFRKNYYGQSSTDFIIDLPETIKNIASITLINTEIPNTIYTFSSKIGTNEFTIETYTKNGANISDKKTHVIRIKNGNYTPEELESYLNRYIFSPQSGSNQELRMVGCTYDKITKKFVFFRDTRAASDGGYPDTTDTYCFNIDWRLSQDKNRSLQLNMGWILGFRKEYYSFEDDYVSESNVSYDKNEGFEPEACYQNIMGQRYIFLSIEDFNKNFSKSLLSPFEDSAINDDNIFAKINNNSDSFNYYNGDVDYQFKRSYFGPVNLMKLRIRLLDEYGRVIDLNNSDYSFTIKLDQVYDSGIN